MKKLVGLASAVCLFFSVQSVWGQASNVTFSGTVNDGAGHTIPGVMVTATNTQTGVAATAISNQSGAYGFSNLQPGEYKLSAALPGFKTQTLDVTAANTPQTVNFILSIIPGDFIELIDEPLRIPGPSAGDLLTGDTVRKLPVIGNDALSLLRFLPGVVPDDDQYDKLIESATFNFAGVGQTSLHTTRDGITVDDGRFNNGAYATTLLHPELIGEIRLILAPVDAELGRGNSQVQIVTRGGTNRYAGSAVWNIRNSALNANTWTNNTRVDPLTRQWQPTTPDWYNNHEYSLTLGGPVVRNRTFFFALWDQQIDYQRNQVQGGVATNTARQGIFRYYEGWNPGNALAATTIGGANPVTPAVDLLGNPVRPRTNPDGVTPYTGNLRCFSVFGNIKFDGSPFTQADCPGGIASVTATPWDARRTTADPTGYILKIVNKMPPANYFGIFDGLNRAAFRWVRRRHGVEGGNVTVGRDLLTDRKQINIRVDEKFATNHGINVSWSHERNDTASDPTTWPGGLSYGQKRHPQVFTAALTSTISPTVLNEARFGLRRQNAGITAPWEAPETREEALQYMIPGRDGYLALVNPGLGNYNFGGVANGVMNTAPAQYNGNKTPLTTYADTVGWLASKHAFKFGVELRFGQTNAYNNVPILPFPRVNGGAGGNASALGGAIAGIPGLNPNSRTQAANLLYFLTGSLNSASMLYWIDDPSDAANGTWEDTRTKLNKVRDQRRHEWSAFWKDDWRLTSDFTLNIGLRYEYYGSPYIASGFTTTTKDQGDGLWGDFRTGGGNPFDRWLAPGTVYLAGYGPNAPSSSALKCALPGCDPNTLLTLEFVGPNSPNPSKRVIREDRNNFGPAVGFSWDLPWFGAGRTIVRGGYQLTYGGTFGATGMPAGDPNIGMELVTGNSPGATSIANSTLTDFAGQYLDLRSVPLMVPVRPTSPALPGRQLDSFASTSPIDFFAYDARFATPYVQNFNLSVTRTLSRRIDLDMRYIGTVAKKQPGILNLNTPNVYHNKELFDALELTRAGGNSPLFDQMFAGLNLNNGVAGYGAVGAVQNNVLQTGSSHLRRNAAFAPLLANGNYAQLAALLGGNGSGMPGVGAAGGFLPLPAGVTGVNGRLLRNGCDRIANGQATIGSANAAPLRCFPENYLKANTQLGGAYLNTNSASSNYHSLQTQLTVRPTQGFTYMGTYTWSKNLGVPGLIVPSIFVAAPDYTDPADRQADYTYTTGHRAHDFRGASTFELPVGPGKLFFGNRSGWLARAIEGWQTSVIFTMNSGARVSADSTGPDGNPVGLYGSSVPDVMRRWPTFLNGEVKWNGDSFDPAGTYHSGTYFENPAPYYNVTDPQCERVTTADNLQSFCTLSALAEAYSGEIVLQNPKPGTRGNFGQRTIELPGNWNFDANLAKTIRISEDGWVKRLQLRVDATNVLNHPKPIAPDFNINNGLFGLILAKGDQARSFQGQLRIEF